MKHELTAKVESGIPVWDNIGLKKNIFKEFEGQKILVTVEKSKRKRSYLQSNYYFGVVVEMLFAQFREFGERVSRSTVHEMLKAKFLPEQIVDPVSGEIIGTPFGGSTTELSTVEFMDYLSEIQQWAAEQFGLVIPDPDRNRIEQEKEK